MGDFAFILLLFQQYITYIRQKSGNQIKGIKLEGNENIYKTENSLNVMFAGPY